MVPYFLKATIQIYILMKFVVALHMYTLLFTVHGASCIVCIP